MRVACTGTSSTGKTTLAQRVVSDAAFAKFGFDYIGTDARALLKERGIRNVDELTGAERMEFQRAYFAKKVAQESASATFITDRSFLDVAAYWIEYTGLSGDEFVAQCRDRATRYDLHVYFPANLLPFERDGNRSENNAVHARVDKLIVSLLRDWDIVPVPVTKTSLEDRLRDLLPRLEGLRA